ncbi:MAG: T9SS type A sorting domain-containing protein, partial [Catalinimonas sp.]
ALGNVATLRWATATEINNAGFGVERSDNGRDFEEVVYVRGAGNTTEEQSYLHADDGFRGAAYYRLRQEDFDGATSYSEVIFLEVDGGGYDLYPNPSVNGQTVRFVRQGMDAGAEAYRLISTDGRVMGQATGNTESLTRDLNRALQGVPAGVYILRVETPTGPQTMRLVRQ